LKQLVADWWPKRRKEKEKEKQCGRDKKNREAALA
jgi:hypothetical protein